MNVRANARNTGSRGATDTAPRFPIPNRCFRHERGRANQDYQRSGQRVGQQEKRITSRATSIRLPGPSGEGKNGDRAYRAFEAKHLDDCAHLFMTAFNAEPWNDQYTLDTAKKQLAWHLEVPGCAGLVSLTDEIVACAIGTGSEPMSEMSST